MGRIRLENINKSFGAHKVLDGINLEIGEGEQSAGEIPVLAGAIPGGVGDDAEFDEGRIGPHDAAG